MMDTSVLWRFIWITSDVLESSTAWIFVVPQMHKKGSMMTSRKFLISTKEVRGVKIFTGRLFFTNTFETTTEVLSG